MSGRHNGSLLVFYIIIPPFISSDCLKKMGEIKMIDAHWNILISNEEIISVLTYFTLVIQVCLDEAQMVECTTTKVNWSYVVIFKAEFQRIDTNVLIYINCESVLQNVDLT